MFDENVIDIVDIRRPLKLRKQPIKTLKMLVVLIFFTLWGVAEPNIDLLKKGNVLIKHLINVHFKKSGFNLSMENIKGTNFIQLNPN